MFAIIFHGFPFLSLSFFCLANTSTRAEFPKPRYVRVNTNAMSRADAIEQFTKDGYVEVPTVDCATYDAFLEIVRKLDTMEYVSDIHVKNLFVFAPQSKRFWAFHDLVKESRVILQDKVGLHTLYSALVTILFAIYCPFRPAVCQPCCSIHRAAPPS